MSSDSKRVVAVLVGFGSTAVDANCLLIRQFRLAQRPDAPVLGSVVTPMQGHRDVDPGSRGHRGICSKSYAKELGAASSVTEQAWDGGATDIELRGDG